MCELLIHVLINSIKVKDKMRKLTTKLSNCNYQNLFMKDPNSDLIIMLQDKVYPVHRRILGQSSRIPQFKQSSEKVLLITNPFDSQLMEKILSYFYGYEISFERNAKILNVLQIIKFFNIQQLHQVILQDLIDNLDEYGIFTVMSISMKMSFAQVYQKCLQQFLILNYEQLFINKFDLQSCEKQFFQYIINQLQQFQTKGIIKGLKRSQLNSVIRQYQNTNNVVLNFGKEKQKANLVNNNKDVIVRKRSLSCQALHSKSFSISKEIQQINESILIKRNFSVQDQTVKQFQNDQSPEELKDLKFVNQSMIEKNQKLKFQLQKIQRQLKDDKSLGSNQDILCQLQQKLKLFKQYSEKHATKFEKIKSQVERLSQQMSSDSKKKSQQVQMDQFFQDYEQQVRPRKRSQFAK